MFDFLFRKNFVRGAQKFIDNLEPKINVNLYDEMPLPSIGVVKQKSIIVAKINAMEPQISKMSDSELHKKTTEFKTKYFAVVKDEKEEVERLKDLHRKAATYEEQDDLMLQIEAAQKNLTQAKQKILNEILPEAFAVVREAGKRVLNMRHFDVQLIGGMVLNDGAIAEMTTGEGKTLVATLPAYLNALTEEGVHVVTVNDYLAKRDSEWMGPIFQFLGLTVGVIQHDMDPQTRQIQYACDITYGTNNEFGFDYLRDNMVNFKQDMVQPKHHFAIVDEVDSILIDEARTPLIISGPAEESTDKYYRANEIAKKLKGKKLVDEEKSKIDAKYQETDYRAGFDYIADEKSKSISLTDAGEEKAAVLFGIKNIHDMDTIEYRHHILQALKAHEFFKNEVDYVIREGQVIIVDEFTGRLMPGRRWSDGLHQAVEAKEGIKIERENQTLATITLQNYFRLYEKLAGMTGTAYTEGVEFKQIYNLDCIVIPTNKKVNRVNHPDCIYRSVREKYNAVVKEIEELNKLGRPVLVGTISIEKSEILSAMLKQKGIAHQVLNAKYHDLEAHIVAQAGRYKGVTIATNMAGRGTDILLGGNAEYLARQLADKEMKESAEGKDRAELVKKFIEQFREQVKQEHEKVVELGGLHVLGTERHEARRIDNQLRGRQGRQGDPGSSRFYVSLEDDLMRLFGPERIINMMNSFGLEEGTALEHPWLSGAIETAQKRVEGHNFEIRKHLLEYDNVMNKQREVIYGMRRSILEREDVKDFILIAITDMVNFAVDQYMSAHKEDGSWDIDGLGNYLENNCNYSVKNKRNELLSLQRDGIVATILDDVNRLYEEKEKQIPPEHLRHLERMILLHTIDTKWKDHLYAMDQLKEGIGLRSFAQRDPLVEYKKEGFYMFQQMYDSIHQEAAEIIFKVQPAQEQKQYKSVFSSVPQKLIHDEVSSLSAHNIPQSVSAQAPQEKPSVPEPIRNAGPKVGRNDPCPCGSGKKYKKCCGR